MSCAETGRWMRLLGLAAVSFERNFYCVSVQKQKIDIGCLHSSCIFVDLLDGICRGAMVYKTIVASAHLGTLGR